MDRPIEHSFVSRRTRVAIGLQSPFEVRLGGTGALGGEFGQELTKIGRTRTREALLESILFPNVRIEQGFRPLKVLTIDGQIFNGLAKREVGIVHLQTNADNRVSIPEDEIDLEQPGEVSIMPTGMLDQLTNQELADLLAVLKNAK